MQTIQDFITLGVENEHDLEHKPLFSAPKIYDANGDLSKRWCVYFSFVNPKTGKLKRMKKYQKALEDLSIYSSLIKNNTSNLKRNE